MSIESKHAYRFGYLKSEQWKTVRLEALVRENARCEICGEESISNDAHHVWYPENIYETTERHLAILCRPCHDFIHAMLPECKTSNEEEGMAAWLKFKNAIIAWRIAKDRLFADDPVLAGLPPGVKSIRKAYEALLKNKMPDIAAGSPKQLRTAYEALRQEHQELLESITAYQKDNSLVITGFKEKKVNPLKQIEEAMKHVRVWADFYRSHLSTTQNTVDTISEHANGRSELKLESAEPLRPEDPASLI